MNKIKKLLIESEKDFICPYLDICCNKKYNQCYNHSHAICEYFDDYYTRFNSLTKEQYNRLYEDRK